MVESDSLAEAARMETPCINVCTLDPRSGLCQGCGRTVEEIARWSGMTDAERAAIMRALPARRTHQDAAEKVAG
jgi:predicted Fe-S protein YdhL (DUF1289 family)